MPSLNKEAERAEKIIRGLLKLPENKRCINCNSLGPQYVCTTFWTFICTSCSGIHREFTHRVKSVSMATFSMEEAKALQAGGNERAREIHFKSIDGHRNSIPDNSNLHKLREFIKHVYVDHKYSGDSNQLAIVRKDAVDDCKEKKPGTEKSNQVETGIHLGHSASAPSFRNSRDEGLSQDSGEKPRSARDAFLELFSNGPFSERPREGKSNSSDRPHRGARDDFLGRRRGSLRDDVLDRHSFDTPSKGVRDDFSERHSFDNSSPRARDEFPERNPSKSSLRNSMSPRNIIEERRSPYKQEEVKSGGQRSRKPTFEIVDDRFREDNNENVRPYESIRYSPRQRDTRKPLAICSAKEALDKKFPPLKPGESIKTLDEKSLNDSPTVQKEEGDQDSNTGKENESIKETTSNMLESDPTPETTSTIGNDEGEKTESVEEGEKKNSPSDDNGEAPSSIEKEASDAQNMIPLECLLLDWTTPSNTAPEDATSTMSNISGSIPSDLTSTNQIQTDLSIQTNEALSDSKDDLSSEVEQGAASVIAESNQNWSPAPATTDMGSLANDLYHPSPQGNSQQPLETRDNNDSQNYSQALVVRGSNESQNSRQALETSGRNESQESKRKELPMDLFAGSYAPFPVRGPVPVAVPGWQLRPPQVMGYGMQYPPVPTYTRPFIAPSTSTNPFDIGGDGTQIAAQTFPQIPSVQGAQPHMITPTGYQNQESSHAFSWQPQQYPYAPGAFQGHQVPYDTMNGSNAGAFASLNPAQQFPTRPSAPTTSNSSSTTGGNPFG